MQIPGFRLVEKRVWWWWGIYYVSLMFLWKPKFMENTWVTLGRDVHVPNLLDLGTNPHADYATINHEAQHVYDRLAYEDWLCGKLRLDCDYGYAPAFIKWFAGFSWTLGYGFPQTLAPLALPGVVWLGWWGLLPLVALVPWPAPFREWLELRGYAATMEGWYEITGTPPTHKSELKWIAKVINKQFLGWGYWCMSWNRNHVERYFYNVVLAIGMRHTRKLEEAKKRMN